MKSTLRAALNPLEDLEAIPPTFGVAILNKERFVEILKEFSTITELALLKNKVLVLRKIIVSPRDDREGLLNIDSNGDTVSLRKDVLTAELNQILEPQTIGRAKYYLERLENGVQRIKTNKVSDINLLRWKEYDDIITDSLWVLDKRDTSGAHLGWNWGNFIPQIPHQMMLRYTKKGDWVLDTFVGSGTTLIECRRLGRNGIGIELNADVAQKATELIAKEPNKHNVATEVRNDDSKTANIGKALGEYGVKQVQLLIMHPPYHDIIKFSNGSVPKVVEKGIGMSYPIGKPTNRKGGYADEERIPQGTGIDHVRAGVIAGRACRPTAGAVRPGGGKAAVNRSPGRRGDRRSQAPAL